MSLGLWIAIGTLAWLLLATLGCLLFGRAARGGPRVVERHRTPPRFERRAE